MRTSVYEHPRQSEEYSHRTGSAGTGHPSGAGRGKTVDELAQDAIKRHLAQKTLERLRREAESQRGNKTDEEVEAIVDTAVQEYRKERSR